MISNKVARQKIKKYGGIIPVIRKYGLVRLIDFGLGPIHDFLVRRFHYKPKNLEYGLSEALFSPEGIDWWCRYNSVVNEIRRSKYHSILDVGSAGEGISEFLNQNEVFICVLDIRKGAFVNVKINDRINPIVGDGCNLPFKAKSFDIITSVSSIEHVPKNIRYSYLRELKRVGRKTILHFPVESNDGLYKGREYDIKFQNAYKQMFGVEEPNTAEHIKSGKVTIEEIKNVFPDAKYLGRKNCDIWLKYMIFSRKPLVRFLAGLFYYLYWKKKDNKPPYYEIMVVWDGDDE